MPKKFFKNANIFICTVLLCTLLFAISIIPTGILKTNSSSAIVAEAPNYTAPYQKRSNAFLCICIDNFPFFFAVTLKPNISSTEVVCIPVFSVQNSISPLKYPLTKQVVSEFLGKSVDGMIKLSPNAFLNWADRVGGVTANTPYGFPAPSGTNQTLTSNEQLHLYGKSIVTLFLQTKHPDRDRLLYYAELFAGLLKSEICNFTKEDYLFLKNNGETDISYSDFFDNTDILYACSKEFTHTAPEGVWINDWYYLQ